MSSYHKKPSNKHQYVRTSTIVILRNCEQDEQLPSVFLEYDYIWFNNQW